MAFVPKTAPFSGKINAVTLGTGDKAIVIGGQNVLPFYTFDAPIENAPKIGVEVSDLASQWEVAGLKEFYAGCTTMADYAKNYSYVVMDNEAGLEHVARGTLPHVDTMLLISDCSRRGVQAVARIAEMIDEMNLNPGQMGLIINRAPGGILDDGIKVEIEKHGLKLFGVLPHDDAVYRCDCDGAPSAKLPDNDPMKVALKGVMQSIGL